MANTREITAAVTSLEISTSAIQSQIKVLVANREYLRNFQAQKAEADAREKDRLRARRLESQNLSLAVEESIAALSGDFQRVEQGLSGHLGRLSPSLAEVFRHDDSILEEAALLSEIDPDDGQQFRNRVSKLTQTLSQLTQEKIRCRLDRIYLESTGGPSQADQSASVLSKEEQLRQDLRSLHVEISDVATMAVTQEFHEPLSSLIDAEFTRKTTQTKASLDQINAAVAAIASSAEACAGKLEALNSQRDAVALLGEEIRAASFVLAVDQVALDSQGSQDGEMTALNVLQERWNITSTTAAGVERDLVSRKQTLAKDREKAQRDLEKALRVSNPGSSFDTDLLRGQTIGMEGLDGFEKEIQQLRKAIEVVDVAFLEKDAHQARLLALWQ